MLDIRYNFGPPIGQHTVGGDFIEYVREYLIDMENINLSNQLDHSERLVGNSGKQFIFNKDIIDDIKYEYCLEVLRDLVVDFLIDSFENYKNNKKLSKNEIQIIEWDIWLVQQLSGKYNPIHHHSKYDVSGVVYIDVPNSISSDKHPRDPDYRDGVIEFFHGSENFLSSFRHIFRPRIGAALVFPSFLAHTVYLFYDDGSERVSLAFNASLRF